MSLSWKSRLLIPLDAWPDCKVTSPAGLHLATGYNRVVIGGRGPYIEFLSHHINWNSFHIPNDQLYRKTDRRSFYNEYRSRCAANVKLYWQKKRVAYADYQIGLSYISPLLVLINDEPCVPVQSTIECPVEIS